jgi:glycosyltransferase involved in cell wall biosynthesis
MHSHKVSILIPVYNREKFIGDCIQSALDQTYPNIEVIVVDNASTDKTWDICQKFATKDCRMRIFRNQQNIGPVRNWLRCVEEARGYYGKILWSDDLIAPTFLEKTLEQFNDNVGFVYSGVSIFTDNPDHGRKSYFLNGSGLYPTKKYINYALYEKGVPVSPGCAIFRLSDIKQNLLLNIPNKVNSDFSMHAIGNDLLLFLLTANNYSQFGFVAETLSFFRVHDNSISISSRKGKLPIHYALAKAYFVDRYFPEQRACLASFIQVLLWRVDDAKDYGIKKVDDFFKGPLNLDKRCFFIGIFQRIIQLPRRIIRKIIGV